MPLRAATAGDAGALAGIYNHYILETVVTFEEAAIDAAEMQGRIAEVQGQNLPWLVAEEQGVVLGYAYAGKWKGRCAYRYSVESTVYLAPGATGRGLGRQLYDALLAELKARGIHVVIGGIALPNAASVALHEACGFVPTGRFSEVGYKFQRWVDVGYWQKTL